VVQKRKRGKIKKAEFQNYGFSFFSLCLNGKFLFL
jgi:uncharacterized protein YggL (DUF469 family)